MIKLNSGIYCIENKIDGKKYIGQSRNLKKRTHKSHRESIYLYRAIEKYGIKNFKKTVLIYCEVFELNRLEVEYIRIFKTTVKEKGYNFLLGGNLIGGENHPLFGKPRSLETKEKLSKAFTGYNNPNFGKKRVGASSQYIGVCWIKKRNCWKASFTESRKNVHIGEFKNELLAAKAYNDYIISNNIKRPLNNI